MSQMKSSKKDRGLEITDADLKMLKKSPHGKQPFEDVSAKNLRKRHRKKAKKLQAEAKQLNLHESNEPAFYGAEQQKQRSAEELLAQSARDKQAMAERSKFEESNEPKGGLTHFAHGRENDTMKYSNVMESKKDVLHEGEDRRCKAEGGLHEAQRQSKHL